ncbi:MAG: hypothetical protein WA642_05730 [Steroidobacteraceae bacterium]
MPADWIRDYSQSFMTDLTVDEGRGVELMVKRRIPAAGLSASDRG